MKRIFVPTNFSEIAWNATEHALEYSRIFEVQVILINVLENSANNLNISSKVITESFSKQEEDMEALFARINENENYQNLNVKYTCVSGPLVDCLKRAISEDGGDLVIMGTKSRKGTIAKLFGSHSSRLIKELECPILLIPSEGKFCSSTPITCAIDYGSEVNTSDLELLEQLVNADPNSVFKIIHIIENYKDQKLPLPLDQFSNIAFSYSEIVGESVPALLEKYAQINNSRLLVLVRKEKGFFLNLFHGGVSYELTMNAHVPLLVLRAK